MRVGDRVRLLENVYQSEGDTEMAPGALGVVKGVDEDGFSYVDVLLDTAVESYDSWYFLRSELELVEGE